jgi:hypothetical protein
VWMVDLPLWSMSRFRLMGSCLNVMRGCVHGLGSGSGRMGDVLGTKPILEALRAVGPEGVSLMASWTQQIYRYRTTDILISYMRWTRV